MLTAREMEALSLIARGYTDREIAALLAVSPSTARKHRENLQRKSGLRKAAQLTIHYLERYAPRDKKTTVPGKGGAERQRDGSNRAIRAWAQ